MSFRNTLNRLGPKALIIPPVLVGIAVLVIVKSKNTGPAQAPPAETSRPLRVIAVPQVSVVPRVLGYGTAKPGDIWTAVAEVKGRVIKVHPELKAGSIIRAGTEVLQIDATDYELRIAALEAEIAQIEAQEDELKAQESNINESLEIEQRSLELAQRELARVEDLRASNAVTETAYDEVLRNVLIQQQTIQSLNSQLNVLPAQRQALTAGLRAKMANLDQARVDRDRTVLSAPFDCRLSDVALEVGQFLTAGQVLFEAYGVGVIEIEAQIPIDQVRRLLAPRDEAIDLGGDAMRTVRSVFDVQATVRMRAGSFVVEWDGRFDRIREELDLQTRTLQIVIAVDNPYDGVVPGKRPPLSPGMFCEVELRGAERPDRIVIPRTSIRDGAVFLIDGQNRLVQRPVTIEFSQGSMSVIADGLKGGERLIVSDPTPAVEGMLVDPILDETIALELVQLAAGEGEVR